jgi:hypothetical protein
MVMNGSAALGAKVVGEILDYLLEHINKWFSREVLIQQF